MYTCDSDKVLQCVGRLFLVLAEKLPPPPTNIDLKRNKSASVHFEFDNLSILSS